MMISVTLRNWRSFKLNSNRFFLYPSNSVVKHTEDGESIFDDVELFDLDSSILDQHFFNDAAKAFDLLADASSIYYSITEAERLKKIADYLRYVDDEFIIH